MAASGKPGFDRIFPPTMPGFVHVPFDDVAAVANAITARTAAVMLEPVQGEAGVLPATVDFLRQLRALTKERQCLLIADEVQTGMGRTGKLFAYEHVARSHDEAPDIMTLGKMLGGGVRQGGVLAAAGLVALDGVDALGDDHENARLLADGLTEQGWQVTAPQTNMLLAAVPDVQLTLQRLRSVGVLAVPMNGQVRFVTHRDVGKPDVEEALRRIGQAGI